MLAHASSFILVLIFLVAYSLKDGVLYIEQMRNCPYVLPKARFLLTLFWNPMVSKAQEMLLLSSLPNLYCGVETEGPARIVLARKNYSNLYLGLIVI